MIRRAFLAGVATAAIAAPALAATPPVAAPVTRRQQGTLTLENVPETPADVREALRRYQNARTISLQDWLPDGSILITTRFGQTAQLHRVAAPGGDRTQLTFFDEPIGGATAIPGSDNRFLFVRDVGGGEYFQAFMAGLTGPETQITVTGTRNQNFNVSPDGKTLVWSQVTAGKPDYDIMTMTVGDLSSRRVAHKGTGSLNVIEVSPDARSVLIQRYVSSTISSIHLLDLASGNLTQINPAKEDVAYSGGKFTDRGSILVASDQGSEFKRLVEIDLATGRKTVVTPADLKWDVEAFDLSPDGRVLAYTINEDGLTRLVLQDFKTRRALPQPDLPKGTVGGVNFSPDGRRLAFTLSSARIPGDVWSWDLADARLTRWTNTETGGLDPAALVDPDLIRFKSFDGLSVPAWIYRPAQLRGRAPVIIDIHGGPEGQARPGFNTRIQYWVNEMGAAVITPNVRGSDGYGKTYIAMDNAEKRQDSVKDIGALLDWIAAQPGLDKDRVVVYGGSYGGFMVLASMAAYNDRLAGGIDIVGISNFTTFLQNTEGYRRDNRRTEYGDERDPKMKAVFDAISPLNLADKMTKPLFVIQGRNDPRVPWTEAEQIVARVRANGGDVWYMIAADEGHGFRKKQNIDAQREAETLFLRKVFKL